jgi:hypothetical protein
MPEGMVTGLFQTVRPYWRHRPQTHAYSVLNGVVRMPDGESIWHLWGSGFGPAKVLSTVVIRSVGSSKTRRYCVPRALSQRSRDRHTARLPSHESELGFQPMIDRT